MKIISRIDDDKFVVQVEENDFNRGTNVYVAHDYFSISTNWSLGNVKGEHSSMNIMGHKCYYVPCRVNIHISIRDMVDIILPFLNQHPYMQKSHLLFPQGSEYEGQPAYTYMDTDVTTRQLISERYDKDSKVIETKSVTKHYTRPSVHRENEDWKTYHVMETLRENKYCYPDLDATEEKTTEYDININEI